MNKNKKPRSTTTPNSQNKTEQAIIQNPDNPKFKDKNKGEIDHQ